MSFDILRKAAPLIASGLGVREAIDAISPDRTSADAAERLLDRIAKQMDEAGSIDEIGRERMLEIITEVASERT